MLLAHTDKRTAWKSYRDFYLSTDGQRYYSDQAQLSVYIDDYRDKLKLSARRGIHHPSSEMISEVYVPEANFETLMSQLRSDFRQHDVNLIYGTVRRIRKDTTSFLNWAKEDYLCVVVNLNVIHTPAHIAKSKNDFRRLFERALSLGGNFYLIYNNWTTKQQVLAGYPQLPEFFKKKLAFDPDELFVSDWYYHYRDML